jgi:hypothetical protein
MGAKLHKRFIEKRNIFVIEAATKLTEFCDKLNSEQTTDYFFLINSKPQ